MDVRRADAVPVRYAALDDIVNRIPVSVVWEITLACDLACSHCGSRAGRMRCDLQTGGRNLTEDRVASAAAAGLCGVGISIDGLGATHDKIRGFPGSYARAIEALRRVRAHGLSAAVNSQINAYTLPQLRELMDVIIEAGATNWQLAI